MDLHIPDRPFDRFRNIDAALNRQRRWFESAIYLRYAAVAALCCPGHPQAVAEHVRDKAAQLKDLAGWFGQLRSELRYVIAAMLHLQGDEPEAFHAEIGVVRELFRDVGMRRDATYEMLAMLVLRSGRRLGGITRPLVQRVKDMYEEMKRYHWWLTGIDDLPACAMLALRDEPVALMAQNIEQIFEGLHKEGFAVSNELQASANLLYLAEGRAELAVGRAGELVRRFKARRQSIRRVDYNEVALLSFLLNGPQDIVDRVLADRDRVRALRPRPDKRLAFNLGANIAFLDLIRADEELLSISQIKLIVDVQAVVAAQRATAAFIAATAGGA